MATSDEHIAGIQGHVYKEQGLRASKRIVSVNRHFEPQEDSCHWILARGEASFDVLEKTAEQDDSRYRNDNTQTRELELQIKKSSSGFGFFS